MPVLGDPRLGSGSLRLASLRGELMIIASPDELRRLLDGLQARQQELFGTSDAVRSAVNALLSTWGQDAPVHFQSLAHESETAMLRALDAQRRLAGALEAAVSQYEQADQAIKTAFS